ncbi:MAG: phosphatase PAP2 family protein [Altererythrobacter sp.]|nr:phosphatase PAP2 family protein [Altererythrobacter sp.]OJU60045.1 MAG: phosphatidic acid phosphatase [Altererythrobacter sp. 66-12]
MRWKLLLVAAIAAGTVASAQTGRPAGYLAPGELDVTAILEPAPRPGDPRYETDRDIFRDTRRLVGSERYALATQDAEIQPAAMLRNFSCAVGVALTPENSPKLLAVVQRAAADTGGQAGRAKEFYKRERPYVIDQGPTCQAPEELFDRRNNRASYDYPSGHSTWGWTWATVLAGAAPDRAQAILERGRAYADSRFVCGVHNESAVEAGMMSAATTMALVQTKPEYQADLAAARQELTALRQSGAPAPEHCDAEAALIAQRVMPALPALEPAEAE